MHIAPSMAYLVHVKAVTAFCICIAALCNNTKANSSNCLCATKCFIKEYRKYVFLYSLVASTNFVAVDGSFFQASAVLEISMILKGNEYFFWDFSLYSLYVYL